MAGDGDTRRADAVGVKWADQTLEGRVGSAPRRMLQIVAQAVDPSILSWTAFHARQERWADLAD